jgi:hypothetical protein
MDSNAKTSPVPQTLSNLDYSGLSTHVLQNIDDDYDYDDDDYDYDDDDIFVYFNWVDTRWQ